MILADGVKPGEKTNKHFYSHLMASPGIESMTPAMRDGVLAARTTSASEGILDARITKSIKEMAQNSIEKKCDFFLYFSCYRRT